MLFRSTSTMESVLNVIQSAYEYPVDIEFTVNSGPNNNFAINLLQCRPLQLSSANENVSIPEIQEDMTYFSIVEAGMGYSRKREINVVVTIDPEGYYNWPHQQKSEFAKLIGQVNKYYGDEKTKSNNSQLNMLLVVPGRIGTSSPELGVPVVFADISNFTGICEVSYSKAGYLPELSFGSHMFQDLVEAGIFYGAIFENEKTPVFNSDLLSQKASDVTSKILQNPSDVIHVYECKGLSLIHDMENEKSICGFIE